MPGTLRESPGFGRVWTAATVSSFGSYVTTTAVQVYVVEGLGEGAAGVGVVNAARWLPYLVFGLLIGALVERRRRRPLLVGADGVRAVLLCAIPVLALTGVLSLGLLAAVLACFGLASMVGDAAAQSFLPRVVAPGLLAAANARLDQGDAAAQTSGPALGGALVSLLGAPLAVLADAASYLGSAVLLLRVPVREPAPTRARLRAIPGEVAEGLRWVYRHPVLRPLALGTHGWFLSSAAAGAVLAPFALRTVRVGSFGFGLVLAAAGVGGVVGSMLATRLGARCGAGRVVIVARAVTALSWAGAALCPAGLTGGILLGCAQLVLGLSMGAENANEMGYRQAVTPDRLQGRSSATMRSVNRAMIVVGAPVGGLLADAFGYRVLLGCAAAGFGLVSVLLAVSPLRTARIPAYAAG